MTDAFILLNVDMLSEKQVVDELKRVQNVLEVYETHGVYDIILRIEAADERELDECIRSKIRKIESVKLALALPIFESARVKGAYKRPAALVIG